MSGFIVQGPKSDDRDSSGLKNGLYPFPAATLFPVASLVFLYARCADHFSLESLSQCQDDTSSIAMVYSTRQVIKETGVVRLPLPL